MATIAWAWAIEAYLGGAWTDISADVMRHKTIQAKRGMSGNDVTDRVAAPGMLSFALNNGESNSGGKLGYYATDSANNRTGFGRDMRVRLKITSGASTKYFIHAWLDDIEPLAGQFGDRETNVTASDYMRWLLKELNNLPVQVSQRPDQLIGTAIAAVPTAPLHTNYTTDPSTWPLGFHLEKDGKSAFMALMQTICKSSLGYFFVAANTTDGETLTYQSRHTRSLSALAATLDNTMSQIHVLHSAKFIRNYVRGQINPIRVDAAATTVLASIVAEFSLKPGESRILTLPVLDPANLSNRISGKDWNALAADTDFKMSSIFGDGGNDLNASFSSTTPTGSNAVTFTVTNNHATKIGNVNKCSVRGRGLYPYQSQDIKKSTGAGDVSMTYDMPYQSDSNVGNDFITAVLKWVSADNSTIDEVWFYPDADSTLMSYFFNVDIGSRVVVKENASGVNHQYFVNQVMLKIEKGSILSVGWKLVVADTAQFFILNDTTYGVLNDTTIALAF